MENRKMYVAYYRVSTQKQGLGLDAQKAMVRHISKIDPSFEYVEKESGKKEDNRPQLLLALEKVKSLGKDGVLVIAKLDRLSRNLRFICELIESKVNFLCCDMPDATPLTLQIFGAMAEHEARMISERTKAGFDAIREKLANGEEYISKRSGNVMTNLGIPDAMKEEARKKIAKTHRENFLKRHKDAIEIAKRMRFNRFYYDGKEMGNKPTPYNVISDELNRLGMTGQHGAKYNPMQVKRLLDKSAGIEIKVDDDVYL